MQNLFDIDEWKIIQTQYNSSKNLQAESIFSIGNGAFGQRANFEEKFSGETLQGNYIGGIYYPDKTKVGWWKNGYPEYFAKVLNSCNWIGINIKVDNEEIDLNNTKVLAFRRELDMKHGTLTREVHCQLKNKNEIILTFCRFCSMDNEKLGVVKIDLTPINFSGIIEATPYLNGKVFNDDSNYDELFWNEENTIADAFKCSVTTSTKKTNFKVAWSMRYTFENKEGNISINPKIIKDKYYSANQFEHSISKGSTYSIIKYVGIVNNLNNANQDITQDSDKIADNAFNKGYNEILTAHKKAWKDIWSSSDLIIEDDIKAQQAIRFNIFQLHQTYTGKNAKLNIGPKGFTGEKYGGATYWDTEAYCLPFYLKTNDPKIAKQLLIYRYNQLDRAIENAGKLGFKNGAALYPMVTMNGEECHNEWEITFEEIHRNGAIAYAIYNYIEHTGDTEYLKTHGLKVLLAIARFWAQRVNWSDDKNQYVILGVTGPNEYENNVNNNWYTNYIAKWCLTYALEAHHQVCNNSSTLLKEKEDELWSDIIEKMYLPTIKGTSIFLQNDGYLDKKQQSVSDIPKDEKPINQHWSWDRILRSCYIKQADVLQGLYFFEENFNKDILVDNFNFYEPKTVHESSLSPCVHSIIATKINQTEKAYQLYLRTSRLDLDDYNHEANEGLHITSMAGTWLAIIEGFAGVKIKNQELHLYPNLPKHWKSIDFNIRVQNNPLNIHINQQQAKVKNNGDDSVIINYGDNLKETINTKAYLTITI